MTKKTQAVYEVEATDTFGGEANYCWVKRFEVVASSMRGAIIKAKKELGYGRHRKDEYGDQVRLDIVNAAICVFITYKEDQSPAELQARETSAKDAELAAAKERLAKIQNQPLTPFFVR